MLSYGLQGARSACKTQVTYPNPVVMKMFIATGKFQTCESILGNHFCARNYDLQKPFSFGKYKPTVSKTFTNRAQACI